MYSSLCKQHIYRDNWHLMLQMPQPLNTPYACGHTLNSPIIHPIGAQMIKYENPDYIDRPPTPQDSLWVSGIHLVAGDDETSFGDGYKSALIADSLAVGLPDDIKLFTLTAEDIEHPEQDPYMPATSTITFEYSMWGSKKRAELMRAATNGFSIRALLDSGYVNMDQYVYVGGHLATSEQLEADSEAEHPVTIFDRKYEDPEMLTNYYSILLDDGWKRQAFIRHKGAQKVISGSSQDIYDSHL